MAVKILLLKLTPLPDSQLRHFHFFNNKPLNNNPTSLRSIKANSLKFTCEESMSHIDRKVEQMVQQFNPKIPIEEASTPPTSWYTDPDFYSRELNRLFYTGWHPVGYTEQIKEPRDYFTGRLGSIEYVVSRDEEGTLHAFHNVCRHHASLLAGGSGKKSCFVCPYHGWTYSLDGALVKATRITGIKNFKVDEMGLVPLKVAIWGPFVLINFGALSNEALDSKSVGDEWLGNAADILSASGVDTSLKFICRRTYTLDCNWKVFCDNYLDGGYHVPYAHKGLSSGLRTDTYSSRMYERVSIQSCEGISKDSEGGFDRLGSKSVYAFIYPNFMINRYGPWMDTNLALPLGPRKCLVIFDYFLDTSLLEDSDFIKKSLEESEKVQEEDTILCNAVQRGLESPAYNVGRYTPRVEMPMHHFHSLLYQHLSSSITS